MRRASPFVVFRPPAHPFAAAAGAIVILAGVATLVGWTLGAASLSALLPGLVPMNPATAVCFILAGVSLCLSTAARGDQRARRAATLCALAVLLVASIRLGGYLAGLDAGIDQLLFRDRLLTVPFAPNRMAPNTAVSFLMVALALLLLDVKTPGGWHPGQSLSVIVVIVSVLAITGYTYGEMALVRMPSYIPMALNTALAFAALSIGTLLARPTQGFMGVITSSGAGGTAARRLVLAAIIIPWTLAWLRLRGQHAGFYGTEFGASLMAVSTMLLLVFVAVWNAKRLERSDLDRRRAAECLRESEQRLQSILDNTTALIYLKDVEGRLLFVNRRCEEVFHIPKDEAVGKTYHDFFPGEMADASRANDLRVLASGQPLEMEELAVHDDGVHTYVSVKFPLIDSGGVPYAVCGISTDITARKQMEVALRESDERLNLALSSASVGTWTWNIVEDTIIWDDHIHRLFGLEPGTFGGAYEDAMRMLHPDDRDRVAREVANAVELDAPYDTEHRVVWPDGGVHVLGARGKVYRDEDGHALRMTGVCWDITERKRADEQLRERTLELQAANEALGSFTYSVSHDLRAPLRAIDGYARILLEDHTAHLDAEGQRVLGVICDNARSMGRLIDDLLAFSRLGRKELEKTPLDLAALAQSVVEELRRLEPDRCVGVTAGPLVPALADGNMMRQVLVNLLGNAWKFTRNRSEATIEIGCTREAGETIYFVKDNGAGFEMEYAGKLFGVFQRLHRAEEFEGTGVGLAIVQRIVQRHGGRVWAEGAVDRGASFYFTLPAEGGTQHGYQRSGDTSRRGQPGGRRTRGEGAAEAEPR